MYLFRKTNIVKKHPEINSGGVNVRYLLHFPKLRHPEIDRKHFFSKHPEINSGGVNAFICNLFENSEIPKLVENILFREHQIFQNWQKMYLFRTSNIAKNILKLIPEV